MQEHALSVHRTARYFVLGDPAGPVREVWMACHGYGQHPAYFLRHFRSIEAPHRLIVAPEGLSRFYIDGMREGHTRVGASWMTREAREDEIQDYVRLLDAVYTEVLTQAGITDARLTALGFSQGGATITRWLAYSPALGAPPAERLILWGSVLPHDLDLDMHGDWLGRSRLTFVVGASDAYATPQRIAEQEDRLDTRGLDYDTIRFEGGHRIDPAVLQRLAG